MNEGLPGENRVSAIGQLELFEAAPVPFLAVDAEGRIADLNREASQILFDAPGSLAGRSFAALLADGHRAAFERHLYRFFKDGRPFSFEAVLRNDQGAELRAHLCGTPLAGRDGRPLLCLTASQGEGAEGVAGRRSHEAERVRLISELKRKNLELEQFTYSVSHDLKSPLHTIKGFVDIMEHDVAARRFENVVTDLARVRAAADRMQELLDAILALSRIGRVIGPKEDLAVGTVVGEALGLLDARIRRRGVRVVVSPELPVVKGDRVRLREVFQNLVENAVKFMGPQSDPLVEIFAQVAADEMRIVVRDNGIGLAERDRLRVFDLFRKLDPEVDGAGVGLALVKRIMEVHGGRVWAESPGPGLGTSFILALPIEADELPS